MGTARFDLGTCVLAGEIYATGGRDANRIYLSSVEKYSPSSDTWIAVAPLPDARSQHAAVAVGSVMYVLGGCMDGQGAITSVLKFDTTQGT
jgi:N-acetylneuraminic acid mutarotase